MYYHLTHGNLIYQNTWKQINMKKSMSLLVIFVAVLPGLAMAEAAPTIEGGASIDADIVGGVVNAGDVSGGEAKIKQSVASIKSGTISGAAKINTDITGGVINAGAVEGGKAIIEQSVASMLDGKVSGTLTDSVSIKGALVNAGAVSGGEADIEQSVGTIGSSND